MSGSSNYKPVATEEPDVLEIKKALATGSGSPDKSTVSGGEPLVAASIMF